MNKVKAHVPFKRRKISDMVAEDLRRWIAEENLQPGDRLPNEKSMLEHYSCSKGTIREALKSLEVQGLVKMCTGPNGGPEVCTVSPEVIMQQLRTFLHFQSLDFEQIYTLRQGLEVMLAKNVVDKLAAEHLTQLQDNIDTYERYRDQGDRISARRTELAFHDILTNVCDNPILAFICRFINGLLRDLVEYRSDQYDEHEAFGSHNIDSHRQILDAYRRQDGAAVEKIMSEHMHCAASFMQRLDAQFSKDLLSESS